MKHLAVVIPAFNEETLLPVSLLTICEEIEKIEYIDDYELILVDDGSTDNTWKILQKFSYENNHIKAIRLSRNFGKESALCAGLDIANADATIVMDCDLQHPPELIAKMVSIWIHNDVDIVEAVKNSRGNEPALSRIAANTFYSAFSKLSGFDLKGASDYKLLDKKVVEAWNRLPEKNLFFRGMSAWLGFEREVIKFDVAERSSGESKWGVLNLVQLALTSITAYSSAPLHLITLLGILFSSFSFILGSYTLFQKMSGVAVDGFTTVIILLLIIGGVTMIALGIIGIYIARIFNEVKGRPRYLVMETANISAVKRS